MSEESYFSAEVIPLQPKLGEANKAQPGVDAVEDEGAAPAKKADGRGNFFAIDRRCWEVVYRLGINAAIAYLVIARGTGGDQRTSFWSVNVIQKRTTINRVAAKRAVDGLVVARLIRNTKPDSKRPRWYIVPASEVPGTTAFPPPVPDYLDQCFLAEFTAEWAHVGAKKKLDKANVLVKKRLLEKKNSDHFRLARYAADAAAVPDWIWLPNLLVDYLETDASGATPIIHPPPIELVRQCQNIDVVKLLVEFYAAHRLDDAGGVHWRALRQRFNRTRVCQAGPWIVWSFVGDNLEVWSDQAPAASLMTGEMESVGTANRDEGLRRFWTALELLRKLGLVEIVPHVVDADTMEGTVIFPCPETTGDVAERALAASARRAALSMIKKAGAERYDGILVPILAHIGNVACVGIFRLRYRPHTGATTRWLATSSDWYNWTDRFDKISEISADSNRDRCA